MLEICKLNNTVLPYPWGSRTVLADLLGQKVPAIEPQAELWMGAHPKAPSRVVVDGRWLGLDELIRLRPADVLGAAVARAFGGELPFLLKVLAAERGLSIQAHPDEAQAAAGFARETALGLALDDERRNYRDLHHKPEILFAIEPFHILRGFRDNAETAALCAEVDLEKLVPEVARLRDGDEGLRAFFSAMLALDGERLGAVLAYVQARVVEGGFQEHPSLGWLPRLAEQFPNDRGILAPLYLNVVRLEPGEAVFTGPGILHAYLEGVGVELMANSDNVLRGGLTTKHVDVDELLRIVRCTPQPVERVVPQATPEGRRYRGPAPEFALTVVEVGDQRENHVTRQGVEILFCSRGQGFLEAPQGRVPFRRGDSYLIPAAIPHYRLQGPATLFRATVA